MTPRGKPLLAFAVLAALTGLESYRLGNPDAAPGDAPADEFSAARAIATLHAVSLDEPHPLGTPAHDAVRDKIAAALHAGWRASSRPGEPSRRGTGRSAPPTWPRRPPRRTRRRSSTSPPGPRLAMEPG